MTSLFGAQSDTILYAIKGEIDSSISEYFPLGQIKSNMIKRNKELNINKDFLDEVFYKDRNSYLLLNLIYPNANFNVSSRNNLPEQDHIFSRDELKMAGFKEDEINSLFNIRYITSISNKKKSNTPFEEWVSKISLEEKKIHLIPEGNWSVRDYKEFLEKRKELFLSKMKEAINISSGEKVEVI